MNELKNCKQEPTQKQLAGIAPSKGSIHQSGSTNMSTSKQANKPIKKAYVRFDDYLDLNEENMRRSCKRLMNHLYSEPTSSSSPIIMAPAISCQTSAKCPPRTGAPIKLVAGHGGGPSNANRKSVLPQALSPAPPTNGKSYLRSRFERRQLRQIDLANKVQQPTTSRPKPIGGDGANGRRQQQDLVAKSHELSKQRFFEKLQRRESIKNLHSTAPPEQQMVEQTSSGRLAPDQEASELRVEPDAGQDQLMPQVYQSIVTENVSALFDTLGKPAKTDVTNDGNNELEAPLRLEFHTPVRTDESNQLIEFSGQKYWSTLVANYVDVSPLGERSSFEIKVPATMNDLSADSLDQPDGLISRSGLLVVKQVEPLADAINLLDLRATGDELPPSSSGEQRREEASTQLAANKTESPFVDAADKVISTTTGQINDQDNREEAAAARATCSREPPSVDSDNQHQATSGPVTISTENHHSNKTKTISSLQLHQTTDQVESGKLADTLKRTDSKAESSVPEDGGDSNLVKDHDGPETGMLVGQSGGVGENFAVAAAVAVVDAAAAAAAATDKSESNSAYPVQTQSAAQAQQVASWQTAITEQAIRDVPPEANGINRTEAIVSEEGNDEKVTNAYKQVNEEKQQHPESFERDGYANASVAHGNDMEKHKNNVNHDQSRPKSLIERANINLMDENNRLIDSLAERPSLVQKQSNSEEDNGSSCSSSGFGASVSVTGSSDGSNSINDTVNIVSNLKGDLLMGRPSSMVFMSRDDSKLNQDPLYDSLRSLRKHIRPPLLDEFNDYKQLVGPDQSYPKGRLVENQNYASVASQRDSSENPIVLERDNMSIVYANLPRKTVEYATVKPNLDVGKKRLQNSSSDASLSGQSYSTASGGFSNLPPAQVDFTSSNNLELLVSLTDSPQKKLSLLKRFGSLVSKAFTVNAAQSATTKTNEPQVDHPPPVASNNTERKLLQPLKPGRTLQQVVEQEQVNEVDLVILPTKHVSQQRERRREEANQTACPHDDRLSRGRLQSYMLKPAELSSATSTTSLSSSPFSSDNRYPSERPKRADSLSGELESLMSQSCKSSNYKKQSTGSKLPEKKRDKSSTKKTDRFEIDCVSPSKSVSRDDPEESCSMTKAFGPRSLMNLFGSTTSQRVLDPTPDLSNSSRREASTCDAGISDRQPDNGQQPISGFWGFSNLMGHSHAKTEKAIQNSAQRKISRKLRVKHVNSKPDIERDPKDRDSSMYTNFHPLAAGYRLHFTSALPLEKQQAMDRYQSMSVYQNLLEISRSYAKRRHCRHGHHRHHNHHHHHHHRGRHTQPLTRYAHNCRSDSSSDADDGDKTLVWGQLIKINKSDGSQVIELQRSPGKPWGFFVARGAIDKTKGIFISRMHDKATSKALIGLLSIGDRILAIDECSIEPDFDILRVNQMISKKSKILLKVKPFKG